MIFNIMAHYYLALILFQPIEELHNCNNPNLIGMTPHYVCVWDKDDFYTSISGNQVLRPHRKKDNKIKAYYRKKHRELMVGDVYQVEKRRGGHNNPSHLVRNNR